MEADAEAWLDGLPRSLTVHAGILKKLLAQVKADPRFRALQVQGSIVRGEGDEYSDVDLGLVTHDAVWPGIIEDLPNLFAGLGDVVDSFHFPIPGDGPIQPHRSLTQYRSGVQLDAVVLPVQILPGRLPDARTLYDPSGYLVPCEHPVRVTSPENVDIWTFMGWHALGEVDKHLRRHWLFSALEWLGAARAHYLRLWAASNGLEYAGYAYQMAGAVDKGKCPYPPGLELTTARLDWGEIHEAALRCAALLEAIPYDRIDSQVPTYTAQRALGPWVRARLASLKEGGRRPHRP
jgi:hypothetical protein